MNDTYNLKHIDECSLEELEEELDDAITYFMKLSIEEKQLVATQEDIGLCFLVMRKLLNIVSRERR